VLFFIAFLKPPYYETPKNAIQKLRDKKTKKKKEATTFVLGLRQMDVTFVILFLRRPLVDIKA
jgi:hypothetical protein